MSINKKKKTLDEVARLFPNNPRISETIES